MNIRTQRKHLTEDSGIEYDEETGKALDEEFWNKKMWEAFDDDRLFRWYLGYVGDTT